MRRLILVFAGLLLLVPVAASAVTVRISSNCRRRASVDETLLALIEVDPSVFPIDTATLKSLKAAA